MLWEAKLIQLLQNGGNIALDYIMLGITAIGSEAFFIVVAAILYWCCNKRLGYKFLNVYLVSVAVNAGLKSLFHRVRPYSKYKDLTHSIGEQTPGYSFPSGHAQGVANLATQGALNGKEFRKFFIAIGVTVTVLVMLSRLYLAQHYLTDVLAGCALGVALALGLSALFELLKNHEERIMFGVVPVCIAAAIIVLAAKIQGDSGENIMKVAGAFMAFSIGYFIEKRCVKFEPKNKMWKNVLKILIGLGVGLALKEGLKYIFPDYQILHFVRYFLLSIWASLFAPLLFKLVRL